MEIHSDQLRSQLPVLPSEIWRYVLWFATSLPIYFEKFPDPNDWPLTRVPDGYDPHKNTKISLSLVSRHFNRITSEFLYEIIHIEKPIQAQRLADALDKLAMTDGCYPGKWMRYMFITMGRVRSGSAATHFTRILRHCDRLVGFSGSWPGSWQFNDWDAEQIQIMGAIPRGVQYLDCDCMMARKPVATPFFTRLSPTLIAMRISTPIIDKAGFAEVLFPRLTHLALSDLHTYCVRSMQNWSFNSLTCLSISHVPVSSLFFQVLGGLGTSLISLRLGAGIVPSEDFFSLMLTPATVLVNFAYQFHPCLSRAWSTIKHHSSLCHITCGVRVDTVRQYDAVAGSIGDHFMGIDAQRLPALRHIVIEGLQELRTSSTATTSTTRMEDVVRRLRTVTKSLGNSGIELRFVQ